MGQNLNSKARVPTGLPGFDEVLGGGLSTGETHIIQGRAGTGKTTLALQFLLERAGDGEEVGYFLLSQSKSSLQKLADSYGWNLDPIEIHQLSSRLPEELPGRQTVVQTLDVELDTLVDGLINSIRETEPDHAVIDSLGVLRLLANNPYRFHKQIVTLLEALEPLKTTVLLIDDILTDDAGADVHGLSHSVILLELSSPLYGDKRRSLRVLKMRDADYHGGYHNFRLTSEGLEVYPRLAQFTGGQYRGWELLESGNTALDEMLGGGLPFGSTCFIVGGAGSGKSSIAVLYACAAARKGKRATLFLFDERPATFYHRNEEFGIDVRRYQEEELIEVIDVDTRSMSPGEFGQKVSGAVESGTALVVVDSLTGYYYAMPQDELLVTHLLEMISFLNHRGVLTVLTAAQLTGTDVMAPVNVSYASDTVLLLHHFEEEGKMNKTLAVVKKRHGPHSLSIQRIRFSENGLELIGPVESHTGILEQERKRSHSH